MSCTLLDQMNESDLILYFLSHVLETQNSFMDLKTLQKSSSAHFDTSNNNGINVDFQNTLQMIIFSTFRF